MSETIDQRVPMARLDSEPAPSGTARLALLASLVIAFLAASAAPTPLYQHYDLVWHGSALITTIAFGIYALAVLVGLLTLGQLATHLGRRPVLLGALGAQGVSVVLFATAGSFAPLLVGRVIQGLATGAALGALGAAMIETHRVRGTVVSSAAPAAGTGLGAIAAGLVVGYLPWPTHLIFLLLLAVFAAQAVGVARLFTADTRLPGALGSLRPKVAVPASARTSFAAAAPVLFAVWALAGFYGSLGPALARELAGSTSTVLGGLGLFILAGVASIAVVVSRDASAHAVMRLGVLTLMLGVVGTIVAIEAGSAPAYFAATALAGVGFGTGFQGGVRTLLPLAEPSERAGLLSAVFVISYTGMGAPAVVAGYLVSRGHQLTDVAVGYAVVLVALALAAAAGLARRTGDKLMDRTV